MLALSCPSCGLRLKHNPAFAGRRVRCPKCGHGIEMPTLAEPLPAAVSPPTALTDTSPSPSAPSGGTVAQPTPTRFEFLAPPQSPDELGRLGPFRVLGVLGEGGMGVVFRGEDVALRRPVALKVMKPGMSSPVERERFLREARTAASVEHENVIAVHHVGESGGVPFLAMPLLAGESLEDRLQREGRLPPAEVVRIGRGVAEGLAAAHDAGLVHRDIKPANVFLTAGRRPSSTGESGVASGTFRPGVKLLDFGLARGVQGDDGLTQLGAIMGTPAYMAPEQTRGEPADARADLFALGCVLYRASTGEPAFRGRDLMSTMVAVAMHEPRPPHEVCSDVPAALSALVMRLLAKDPMHRPASAQAVAGELAALDTAPTAAISRIAPPRRRRAVRWVAIVAVLLAIGGIAVLAAFLLGPARAGVLVVQVTEGDVHVEVDGSAVAVGPGGEARLSARPGDRRVVVRRGSEEVFADTIEVKPGVESVVDAVFETRTVRWKPGVGDGGLPGLVERPAKLPGIKRWQAVLAGLPTHARPAWHPDGKSIAYGCSDGTIRMYDVETLRLIRVTQAHEGRIWSLAWSPDGTWLATAGDDHTARLWRPDGTPGSIFRGHKSGVNCVAWRPDGKRIASGGHWGDGCVRVWDLDGRPDSVLQGKSLIQGVAFSPDGRFLAAADSDARLVHIWAPGERTAATTLGQLPWHVTTVAWRPDGKQLATNGGEWGGKVGGWIWDTETWKQVIDIPGCGAWVNSAAWSARGQFATGTQDGFVRLHDPTTGKTTTSSIQADPLSMIWSPDGRRIADTDGRLFEVTTGAESLSEVGRREARRTTGERVAWDRADGKIAWACVDRTARIWSADGTPGPVLTGHRSSVTAVAWSPDGGRLATADSSGTARVWEATGKQVAVLTGHTGRVWGVSWSPDGKRLATGGDDKTVRLWSAEGGEGTVLGQASAAVLSVAWSSDGKRVATGEYDGPIRVWEVAGGPNLVTADYSSRVYALAWSPDNRTLATAGLDGTVRLWGDDLSPQAVLRGHAGSAYGVDWSKDGKRLVSCGEDGTMRIWTPDGKAGPSISGPGGPIWAVAFSPDGQRVAPACAGSLRVTGLDGSTAWTAIPLAGGKSVTLPPGDILLQGGGHLHFSPAGELLRGERESVDAEVQYIVEDQRGKFDVLAPAEFRRRFPGAAR